ncbi:LysR family transcriptional regulator [Alterinioella nitratireducens]|uniref:LysR family transcriptional regulator n=1 Tax=Alterinioella nitratireducens TaxID=2735915 RepID=UPI0015520A9A|nr:LysR family transcriptional regulator [Alterinioella nitratireducens]NPD21603.1 LysR family transcriptional regulator [Alterinioella nitratireducens]
MDHIWRLKHFLAIAELGSVQAAARHLNISQPALSKSLRELEQHLGSALFERSSRGVTLTQAGQAFLARSREIELQWDGALFDLTATRDGARGNLRIGVGPTYEAAFMAQVLARLLREFPNLQISVRTGVGAIMLPALNTGEIGIYFGGLRSGTESLASEVREIPLYDQSNRIVAAADDPLAAMAEVGAGALSARAWVQLSYDSLALERIEALFQTAGVPLPRTVVSTHSLGLALDLVRNKGFLTSLPEPLLHPRLGFGLAPLAVPGYDWRIATGISYRTSLAGTAPLKRMIAIVRDELGASGLGPDLVGGLHG